MCHHERRRTTTQKCLAINFFKTGKQLGTRPSYITKLHIVTHVNVRYI